MAGMEAWQARVSRLIIDVLCSESVSSWHPALPLLLGHPDCFLLIIAMRGSDARTAYALYKKLPSHVVSRASSVLVTSKAAVRRESLSHRSFGSALVAENDGLYARGGH